MAKRISKKDMPPKVHQLIMMDDNRSLEKWLSEYPMDIEIKYRKESPGHAAIRYNSMKCLKVCLNFEGDTSDNGQCKVGLLKHAIINENKKAVKMIVEKSNNIYDQSILEVVISLDAVEILTLMKSLKIDIFAPNADGQIPLMYATFWGAYKCKRFLYNLKPPLSIIMYPNDECGNIFRTIMERNDYDAFKMIVNREDFKDFVNAPYVAECEGQTNLHFAAKNGHIRMVKQLVKKGANVNAIDSYGETPLHEASSVDVVKFLIENGADNTIKNNMDQTPEDVANCKMDQKRLAICQWYILNKKPEEKVVYGTNLQGYLKGITRYQPPFEKVCPFRLQTFRKQKKEIQPRKKLQQTRYTKKDLSEDEISKKASGEEDTEGH